MWQKIWQKKGENQQAQNENGRFSLKELLSINGYDTSGNALNEQGFVAHAHYVGKLCNLQNGSSSLLEIGCGAGVYLKLYDEFNKNLNISALDYSQSLIDVAQKVIPRGTFCCAEAAKVGQTFAGKSFDCIICCGVVIYFPNKEYAFDVMQQAYHLLKKGGNLAFLDLNDSATKDIYHQQRRGNLSVEEYQNKYKNLDHLFLDRQEVFDFFNQLGFEKIIVEDQHIEGYINNPCRFNVFAIGKK